MSSQMRANKDISWQSNYLFSTITLLAKSLIPLFTYPYLARVLLVDHLGKYNFGFSVARLFFFAIQLGLPYYGAREIAKASHDPIKLKKTQSELFGLSLTTGFIFSILYFLAIVFIPQINQEKELFFALGLMVLLAPLLVNWLLQGLQLFRFIAVRVVIFRIIGLILMFLFIRNVNDYVKYGLIMSFVMVGFFPFNLIKAKRITGHWGLSFNFKRHIKPALLTMPVNIVKIVLFQISSIMLGFLALDADVAFFSIPAQIIMVISSLLVSLSFVMVPTLTKIIAGGNLQEYKKTTKSVMNLSWFLVIPICAGLLMTAKEIIVLFAGVQYAEAALTLQIGAFRLLAIAVSNFIGSQILLCHGEEKKLFISLIFGITLMVILNLFLIPSFGHVGAMIGTVIAEYAFAVVQLILGRKYISIDMILTKPLPRYILLSLLFIPICLLIKTLALSNVLTVLLCIASCMLVYIGALLILKDNVLKEFISRIFNRNRSTISQ